MATTNKFKMIDNYIYFYHLDKFCILPTYPDSITDNLLSNFAATNALSRSAPVFSYANSGPRTVSVNLKLHRDLMNDLNKSSSNIKHGEVDLNRTVNFSADDYVDTLVNHLQAVALPRYQAYNSGSKTVIPPMIAIRFGNNVFIKGVVTSGIQCTYSKPILYNDKYAVVEITFSVSETEPFDADTVAAVGSFRGITHAFNDGVYSTSSEGNNNISSIRGADNLDISPKKGIGSTTHYSSSGAVHGGGGSHSWAVEHGGGGSHKFATIGSVRLNRYLTDYYKWRS